LPIRRGRKESSSIRTPEQVRWDYVRRWLEKATDDLSAAELLVEGELATYWTVSFHAQQAAEKALKALLTRHQIEFVRTHSIGELLQLAEPAASGISARLDTARDLTRHAVLHRYPGEDVPVSQVTARQHIDLARTVLDAVKSELHAYLEAGPPSS
jgi:HEPN domain-containing protein